MQEEVASRTVRAREVFFRHDVGAPQSASFDEGGNLWLLDGPKLGVVRQGEGAPSWFDGAGKLGRGALGARVCGAQDGAAVVHYAAASSEVERFVLGEDGEDGSARVDLAKNGASDCQRSCANEALSGLPRGARPTRCVRDGRGVLWIGTLSHGLWRAEGGDVRVIEEVPGRWVRELSSAHHSLLVLTERGVFTAALYTPDTVVGAVHR